MCTALHDASLGGELIKVLLRLHELGRERLAVDKNCVVCAPQVNCGFKNYTEQLAEKCGGGKSFYENRVNLTFTGFKYSRSVLK